MFSQIQPCQELPSNTVLRQDADQGWQDQWEEDAAASTVRDDDLFLREKMGDLISKLCLLCKYRAQTAKYSMWRIIFFNLGDTLF